MKKILFSLMLMVSALSFAPTAQAVYHKEMAEFAGELNKAAAEEGMKVSYDPSNDRIIMKCPSSFFSADAVEALSSADISIMKPIFLSTLAESMGKDTSILLGTVLDTYDTKLAVQMQLGNKLRTITVTGKELSEAAK